MNETEGEVKIDIDGSVTRKSTSNAVDVRVTHETEVLLKIDCGKVVTLGTGFPPPFRNTHILLKDIVSFDPHNMYHLLYKKTQDHILCNCLSDKIASEAERVPGPLYISLHVTLTPYRYFIVNEDSSVDEEIGDMETCAICLEEDRHLSEMSNCTHVFHEDCIDKWLRWSNACPLCREDIDDDYDYQ